MKRILIVCDGSCPGNGTPGARGGAAAIVSIDTPRGRVSKTFTESLGPATNQRAEIVAVCIGLEALTEPCEVEVHTDSMYVIETLRGAYSRRSNLDLWKRLDRAAERHTVTPVWVRGHSGDPLQERADALAREAARRSASHHATATI